MRSNLKNVVPTGFFRAPYPIRRAPSGFEVVDPKDVNNQDQFLPFLIRQAMSINPIREETNKAVYDTYCPSIRTQIKGA